MKSSVEPMRAVLTATTQEALEGMADQLFASLAVKKALMAAAGQGLYEWTLAASGPVDLRSTKAAMKLIAWLDGEALIYDWQARVIPGASSNVAGTAYDLKIRWDGERMKVAPR